MLYLFRKTVLALVAVGAVGAVGAGSAGAASWHVGGSELVGSASLASLTSTLRNVKLESFDSPSIECSSAVELKGASITASAGGRIEHLVLRGCHVTSPSCSLGSEVIESNALTVEAALGGKSPEDVVVLKPATKGGVIAEYEIVGCSSREGERALTGSIKLVLEKGGEELAAQPFAFDVTSASRELRLGESGVSLTGAMTVKLASGKSWSFH